MQNVNRLLRRDQEKRKGRFGKVSDNLALLGNSGILQSVFRTPNKRSFSQIRCKAIFASLLPSTDKKITNVFTLCFFSCYCF